MKHPAFLLCGATALVAIGCHGGGSGDDMEAPVTQVELAASPEILYAGDPITFTVTAHNDQLAISTVSVDFTDDGTWDSTQSFDSRAVTATFTHVYPNPGAFSARAEVTDANGTASSRSMILSVATAPLTLPVTYVLDGVSPQGGGCYAVDPPATCSTCAILVGTSTTLGVTRSMGQYAHGAHVSLAQGFSQWPLVANRQTYSCRFYLHLFAGAPGNERSIGGGSCETTSQSSPAQLECRIAVAGTVP